jgi:hypothetical protein
MVIYVEYCIQNSVRINDMYTSFLGLNFYFDDYHSICILFSMTWPLVYMDEIFITQLTFV